MERAPDTSSKGMNPTKAFAIVAGVVVVIAATWYLAASRSEVPSGAAPQQTEPDFSLTNEEAITRARELEQLVLQAYSQRDLSLLQHIYSSDSPLLEKTTREIQYLSRRDISARPHFRLLDIEVLSNENDEVVLKERAEFDIRFRDKAGNDVTGSGQAELQTTRLTLRLQEDRWLIFDSVITKAEPLR